MKPLPHDIQQWARASTQAVLDIAALNTLLVEGGAYPTLICEMKTRDELHTFKHYLDMLLITRGCRLP
jgi:hypothetical protein